MILFIFLVEIEMATNRNYDELSYYWEQWREISGKMLLSDYPLYSELINLAAHDNGTRV